MKQEISSLFDNELGVERQQVVMAALRENPELRMAWGDYQLIGDTLRRSGDPSIDLTSRIMNELRDEPTVLAPPLTQTRTPSRYMAALAAALAGVAIVGWLALSTPTETPQKVALAVSAPGNATITNANLPAGAGRMQEYLVAHQIYSPGHRFDGGVSYIRTVSSSR